MANLDKNKAATWITAHANASSHGKCATYVRQALEAGGLSTAGHPVDAKNYGPFLQMQGFSKVGMQGYFPQKGDVVVIQNHPGGSPSGDIAFYTGTQWVSDYRQSDIMPGSFYRRDNPPMQVYRP